MEGRRSDNNRPARYYALTRAGERRIPRGVEDWRRAAGAVERILATAGEG